MSAADEVWALVADPLDNLRVEVVERPELSWPELRENLHRELSGVTAGPVVEQLIGWLDDLSDSDRTELLGSDDLPAQAYQVVTHAVGDGAAGVADDAGAAYDENAWFAYLSENGARWDGTAESWASFREWFLYDASEAGFGSLAGLLLDHLDLMAPADRIALLAQYGVTIQPPAPAVAALPPRAQQVMDELLRRKPQYADIPEARRIELVTEFLERRENRQ